ncbi:MAG: YceI family protein [Bacteroidota bacterium]|nr:YceI family protein [Bacteroidota bacterium]
MKKLIISASALLLCFQMNAQMTWSLDKSHTKLGFTTTHLMVSETTGDFKKYDIKLTSKDETFVDATVEATIDVNSVLTDQPDRDAHLKRDDMFDAAKFPTITFKSTSFKKAEGNKFKVAGNLTIKGVTKPVVLDVTLLGVIDHPMAKKRDAGFKFTTTIKRTDFGVGAGMPGAMVGDDITISGSSEFFKD